MRRFVPPNITSTTLKKMKADGVPDEIAQRIWQKKILWLIGMHPEDLPKVFEFIDASFDFIFIFTDYMCCCYCCCCF